MDVRTETIETPEDEISLLDVAVAVAESWKLIVFGPLLVGLLVFGFLHLTLPERYVSEALLQISPGDAALLKSASVIDGALEEAGWVSRYGSIAAARRELQENQLTAEKVTDTGYHRVTLEGDTPELAQAMLTTLIAELIRNSAPRGEAKAALEQKLQMLESSLATMKETLDRLNAFYDRAMSGAPGTMIYMGEAGQSYERLISSIKSTEQEILALQLQLEGSVTASDIIQPPTLDEEPLPQRKLLSSIVAMLGTGFILLIFAFLRAGFARAAEEPRSAEKVKRIQRAFQLRSAAGKKAAKST